MTSPTLNMTDRDIQASLALIEGHSSNMRNAITHVDEVGTAINAAYQSTASVKFQQQLDQWGEIYNELLRNVDTMQTNLASGKRVLNNTNEESGQLASGLSSQITSVIHG